MSMSFREILTALHGMVFGAVFLLTFSGAVVGIWSLRSQWLTGEGLRRLQRPLAVLVWTMAVFCWMAVLVGTWVIYPWYRAKPLTVGGDLSNYPKYLLLSRPNTTEWHEFGMEWKEHIAWLTPILATAVAFVVTRYRDRVANNDGLRRMVLFLYGLCFACAAVAGAFGALINKAAPVK